ncbi:hypothetical protein OMF51_19330, partial [Bordetella pertussis]
MHLSYTAAPTQFMEEYTSLTYISIASTPPARCCAGGSERDPDLPPATRRSAVHLGQRALHGR